MIQRLSRKYFKFIHLRSLRLSKTWPRLSVNVEARRNQGQVLDANVTQAKWRQQTLEGSELSTAWVLLIETCSKFFTKICSNRFTIYVAFFFIETPKLERLKVLTRRKWHFLLFALGLICQKITYCRVISVHTWFPAEIWRITNTRCTFETFPFHHMSGPYRPTQCKWHLHKWNQFFCNCINSLFAYFFWIHIHRKTLCKMYRVWMMQQAFNFMHARTPNAFLCQIISSKNELNFMYGNGIEKWSLNWMEQKSRIWLWRSGPNDIPIPQHILQTDFELWI